MTDEQTTQEQAQEQAVEYVDGFDPENLPDTTLPPIESLTWQRVGRYQWEAKTYDHTYIVTETQEDEYSARGYLTLEPWNAFSLGLSPSKEDAQEACLSYAKSHFEAAHG